MDQQEDGPDLADSVEALLGWIARRSGHLPLDQRSEFAANLLLNALLSVLEDVRRTAPDRHGAYVRMSVTMLSDD
jgi:hypothetical protein